MEAKAAEKAGLNPMGRAWAGPPAAGRTDGHRPGVPPVPRLLERFGLKVDDIDLWELNEAFASQCLYSRDQLHIDPAKYNVNGGSIARRPSPGHDGARGRPATSRGAGMPTKYAVVTMCIGGGQGGAGLFESSLKTTATPD